MTDQLKIDGLMLAVAENNKLQQKQIQATKRQTLVLSIFGLAGFTLVIWLIWYIMKNNVVGNALWWLGGC